MPVLFTKASSAGASSFLLQRSKNTPRQNHIMLRAGLSKRFIVRSAGAAISTTYFYQNASLSPVDRSWFSTTTTVCEKATSHPYLPPRSEQIQRLTKSNTPESAFDVLVIGGGATGSGVALDAATRGLNTCLIERGDFGTETSARSTKLIWAGIRYIAVAFGSLLRWKNFTRPVEAMHDFKSEFDMVMGAQKERTRLLENNPHLTNWGKSTVLKTRGPYMIASELSLLLTLFYFVFISYLIYLMQSQSRCP